MHAGVIEHVGRHENKLKGMRERLDALRLQESEARAQLDKFEKKVGAHRNITAHRSSSQPSAGSSPPPRKKRVGRPSRRPRAPPPIDAHACTHAVSDADTSADSGALSNHLSNAPSAASCASAPATFDGGGAPASDGGMAHSG
jgi:hypothetical protein